LLYTKGEEIVLHQLCCPGCPNWSLISKISEVRTQPRCDKHPLLASFSPP